MISNKQTDILECYERQGMQKKGIEPIGQIRPPVKESLSKLISNLMDKEKYIVHYRNLQLYLSLGMRIKKVYCVYHSKNIHGVHRL